MNAFMETSIVPAQRKDHWTRPHEQVSWTLAERRLERRERAASRARTSSDRLT